MKARAIAAIVTAGLVASGIAGCTFVTPVETQNIINVTDGVDATIGDVKLLNALVISKNGTTGNLVAQAYNESGHAIKLTLQYDVDGRQTITVPLAPNGATKLGYGSKGQVFLPKIGTKPGGLLPLYVQYGNEPGKQITVPVLGNQLAEYQSLLPTPTRTPTPKPSATLTPTPTATPGG